MRLYRYVTGEFLFSFFVAFAFFFFVFFVNQLLLLAEDVLQKDVAFSNVLLLIIYSLPAIIALSVPFATLVGALMAIGRLSSDSEMVAMQACGIPTRTAFFPILVSAVLLSIGSFFVNDYLLPLGTMNFGRLYRELLYANPALELEPNSVKRYQDDVLVTGSVSPGTFEDMVIIDTDSQGHRRVIVADQAGFNPDDPRNLISLRLDNVVSHTHVDSTEYQYSTAERMEYNILLQDITVAIRSPGPREMSARDVADSIEEKEAALRPRMLEHRRSVLVERIAAAMALLTGFADNETVEASTRTLQQLRESRPEDRTLQVYRLEYHKKFSIPLAGVSFVVLAFPLGLFTKRSGRSVGFGIGLFIATAYWALLIGGQTFGTQRADVSPVLAMWMPNAVFLLLGLVAFFRRRYQ